MNTLITPDRFAPTAQKVRLPYPQAERKIVRDAAEIGSDLPATVTFFEPVASTAKHKANYGSNPPTGNLNRAILQVGFGLNVRTLKFATLAAASGFINNLHNAVVNLYVGESECDKQTFKMRDMMPVDFKIETFDPAGDGTADEVLVIIDVAPAPALLNVITLGPNDALHVEVTFPRVAELPASGDTIEGAYDQDLFLEIEVGQAQWTPQQAAAWSRGGNAGGDGVSLNAPMPSVSFNAG